MVQRSIVLAVVAGEANGTVLSAAKRRAFAGRCEPNTSAAAAKSESLKANIASLAMDNTSTFLR
jgi:hypothetical protein